MNKAGNTVFYRRIEIVQNILAEIINFLPVFGATVIVYTDMAGGRTVGAEGFWLPVAVLLFYYFLREVSERLPVFLLFHIFPLAGIIFFYENDIFRKVIMAGIVSIYMILSISKRVKGQKRGMEAAPPAAAVGAFFLLYLLDGALGQAQNSAFLLEMTIFFLTGYFVHYFLRQFLYYVDMNTRSSENMAAGHIFYPALGVAGGFSAGAAILAFLCSDRELMERLSAGLRRIIIRFLTFLISLLPKQETEQEMQVPHQEAMENVFDMMGEPAKESLLLKILDMLFMATAFVLVTVFFLLAVAAVIRLIRSGFSRKRKARVIEEELYTEQAERIVPGERKAKKGGVWGRMKGAFSPEEKIRRIYRKTLAESAPAWMGEKKTDILKYATARECCAALFPDQASRASDFARLYEKARYGCSLCTGEDVRQAKTLAEELLQGRFHRKEGKRI
ncbi:MAG: DUF4129 domain-containing protein [Lachnospiraceae bacterium]|nr:DUF4129 domain-containing protein [Lachnospiraceae bacterium]